MLHNLQHDPLPWLLWNLTARAWRKSLSLLLSKLFHAPGLYLGAGCKLSGTRHIRFGKNFYVNGALWLDAVTQYRGQHFQPVIEIGDNVSLSLGVHITAIERIVIGNGVLMGSHIFISDHNHGSYSGEQQSAPGVPPSERPLAGGGPVIIGDHVWIGDNVAVLGPASIGEGAVLAANCVVRGDVPPNTIVGGIPARPLKFFDKSSATWKKVP